MPAWRVSRKADPAERRNSITIAPPVTARPGRPRLRGRDGPRGAAGALGGAGFGGRSGARAGRGRAFPGLACPFPCRGATCSGLACPLPCSAAPAPGWPARSPGGWAPGWPPACPAGSPFPRPGDPATARPGAAEWAPAWRRLARHWPPRARRPRAGRPWQPRAGRQCPAARRSRLSPRRPGCRGRRQDGRVRLRWLPVFRFVERGTDAVQVGRLTAPAVLTARFPAVVLRLAHAAGEAGRRCPVPRPTPLAARRRKCCKTAEHKTGS